MYPSMEHRSISGHGHRSGYNKFCMCMYCQWCNTNMY